MTGIRIAATLGGFFFLMVFLIVYKSRSHSNKALRVRNFIVYFINVKENSATRKESIEIKENEFKCFCNDILSYCIGSCKAVKTMRRKGFCL